MVTRMPMIRKNKTERIIIRCTPQTKNAWESLREELRVTAEELLLKLMEHYRRVPLV